MSCIVNNLHKKIIIFVIYFNKITLILHPGSQYHVNIIGTHPHNLPSSSILPPLLIYMVLPPPNLEDIPPLGCFWHLSFVCLYVKYSALSCSLTEASAYNKQFAVSQGGPLILTEDCIMNLSVGQQAPFVL